MIFQFKITLKDVGVPVWRRIQVESDLTFAEFHQVIQLAFDWLDMHLHGFEVRKSNGEKVEYTYIKPLYEDEWKSKTSLFFQPQELDESQEVLANWFKKEKDRMFYTYDFGDDWDTRFSWRRFWNQKRA